MNLRAPQGCQVPNIIVDDHREPARSYKGRCELELYEQNGISK